MDLGKNFYKKGYTLAEVVIVMLIIAVVVAISIRAAKTKMDNIITYNYYAAFETMRNVTKELLLDYDADDEIYQAKYSNYAIAENKEGWFNLKTLLMNPVWAANTHLDDILQGGNCEQTGNCVGATECSTLGGTWKNGVCYNENLEPGGGTGDVIENPNPIDKPAHICDEGQIYDSATLSCKNIGGGDSTGGDNTGGGTGDGTDPGTGGSGGGTSGGTDPGTGGSGGGTSGGTDPGTGGSGGGTSGGTDPGNSCDNGFHWDTEEEACVPNGRTIPKKDLCPNFESQVNTKSLVSSDSITEFCKGDSISDSDTDFSEKDPDLILRNGMRLYNLSQPYVEIEALKDGAAGAIFIDADGNEIDTNKNGYIVYADIDGLKGESKLWVDVFPFYITLSGHVIPAYPADGSAGGGNDKFYLATSLSYEKIDGNTRSTNWLTKSVSYQESACKSGYIDENTEYCGDFTKENACKEENIDCRIKYIKPSPFFK